MDFNSISKVKRRVDSSPPGQRDRGRTPNPNLSNYNVEFINPKGRDDLERGGGSSPDNPAVGGAAGSDASNPVPDDDWVRIVLL